MSGFPTLIGIKKLQRFLKNNNFELPHYQLEVYQSKSNGKTSVKLITVPLSRYLRIDGKNHEVVNKRITSRDGKTFVRFCGPVKCDLKISLGAILDGADCLVLFSPDLSTFMRENLVTVRQILKTKL